MLVWTLLPEAKWFHSVKMCHNRAPVNRTASAAMEGHDKDFQNDMLLYKSYLLGFHVAQIEENFLKTWKSKQMNKSKHKNDRKFTAELIKANLVQSKQRVPLSRPDWIQFIFVFIICLHSQESYCPTSTTSSTTTTSTQQQNTNII